MSGAEALRARLRSGPPLILDGGLGSMLLARGLESGNPPELWNVERPQQITQIHRLYVEAGAEAIHTNTFGGNRVRLGAFGLGERCRELNLAAVERAREAGARFVLGDVGPTGEYLAPVGAADPVVMREAFLEQGRALVEAGVDALHVETMSDLREAKLALEGLREAAGERELPVMVSLTFERKKRGFFTVMGDPLVATLCALASAGADAVGANCSITSGDMAALVAEAVAGLASAGVDVPLVAQANAGQPQMGAEGLRYDHTPEAFAADMVRMLESGARAIGGCCGTEPATIEALCRLLGRRPGSEGE